MAGPLIGNPQDVLTTPYGYTGQMAPETAIKEQALNRRRLIANMLMQKGLQQGPGGKMVGRFYVGDSPLQGGANLAASLAGVLGARSIDTQQDEAMTADRQMVLDAINAHKEKLNPRYQSPAESSGIPASALQGPGTPTAPPQAPGTEMPTRPEGPYQGEVGAVPMPEPGVQSAQPPIQAQPQSSIAGQENMQGLNMDQAQPADMSAMVQPPGTQGQPLPSPQVPAPTPSPVRMVEPPGPRKPTMDDIADLMTHQHPQVRAYGQFMAQQMQREQEHTAQREFMSGEKALDRDVRREGILENSRMREAQMQNTMALTQMQIDAKVQQGHDANELKASLAKQANDLQKLQMQTTAELKKTEIGSRTETAKQHDETMKSIAQMNMEGRKDIAALKTDSKGGDQEKSKRDVEGIIAVLRDSYNQLRASGGVTDTEKSGLSNTGAAAGSSGIGQAIGKIFGTQNQSHRNTIAQQRPILMGNISKALGMSAKQLDSNAELKLWLNAATDPTLDYQTNMRALDQLESMLGGSAGASQPTPAQSAGQRTVKRSGTHNGKKVVEYSDGTIEYAP